MLSALARRGKYRHPRQSFALVIVLAMVALLTVTIVAIYSYLTSDASLSSANENLEQARAQARLGLDLAVEQLQELAGPDQRVTATADILSANGYAGVQANAYRKHWTGVWNTSSYSVRNPGTKYFLGWLVSGTNTSGRPAMTNTLTLATSAPGSSDVLLVSSNTVDTVNNPTDAVTAPLINVLDEKGRVIGQVAWWTGDEGVKARVNLPTPSVYASGGSTTSQQQNFMATAQNLSQRQVALSTNSDGSGTNYFQYLSGTNANLGLVRTLSQIGLLDTTGTLEAGVYENWHDITTYSQGVIADTVDGGLRLDLTSLFGNARLQTNDTYDPTTNNYPPYGGYSSGWYGTNLEQQPMFLISSNDFPINLSNYQRISQVGPNWDVLARYYRYYDKWNWSSGSFIPRPATSRGPRTGNGLEIPDLYPNMELDRDNVYMVTPTSGNYTNIGAGPMDSRFQSMPASMGAGPAVVFFQLVFRLGANQYTDPVTTDPASFYLCIIIQPDVILWNPYDVPLSTATYNITANVSGPIMQYGFQNNGYSNWIQNSLGMELMQNDPPVIGGYSYSTNATTGAVSTNSILNTSTVLASAKAALTYFQLKTSFLPGEVKVFSLPTQTDWDAPNGSTNGLAAITNAWSSSGGLFMTNINLTTTAVPNGQWTATLAHNQQTNSGSSYPIAWSSWPPEYNSTNNTTNWAGATTPMNALINLSSQDPTGGNPYTDCTTMWVLAAASPPFEEMYAGTAIASYGGGGGYSGPPYTWWNYPNPTSTLVTNYTISLPPVSVSSLTNSPQPIGAETMQFQPAESGFVPGGTYNYSMSTLGKSLIQLPLANSSPRALYADTPQYDNLLGIYCPQSAPLMVSVKNGNVGLNLPSTFTSGGLDSYFGPGADSSSGSTCVTMYSIPTQPFISMGQFQHAPVSYHVNEPAYPIGNSRIPDYFTNLGSPASTFYPQAPPGETPTSQQQQYLTGNGTLPGDVIPVVDVSWYLNNTIWDHYFLSSVPTPKQITDGFFSSNFPGQTFNNAYVATNGPLPNSRMAYYWRNGSAPTTNSLSDYQQAAANLMINGAFNINSTSVEAWKAELASLNGGSITTTSGNVVTALQNPVSRLIRPNDENTSTSVQGWNYFTQLTDAQIETLAQDIVTQVKARGPFSSLAEFVNRALANVNASVENRTEGALQAAIDNSGINSSYNNGNVGATMAVSQGDLLEYLAPILAARSDTFIIRAFGQSINPVTGAVRARAWCQALVQRVPDYINSADPATNAVTFMGPVPGWSYWGANWTNPPASNSAPNTSTPLSSASQTLGRRFRIIAFQWLNDSEL